VVSKLSIRGLDNPAPNCINSFPRDAEAALYVVVEAEHQYPTRQPDSAQILNETVVRKPLYIGFSLTVQCPTTHLTPFQVDVG
jgi:hypothetical protein